MLQIELKKIWNKYILIVFLSLKLTQFIHIANDIKIYKLVQTGPKTDAGGLNDGLII